MLLLERWRWGYYRLHLFGPRLRWRPETALLEVSLLFDVRLLEQASLSQLLRIQYAALVETSPHPKAIITGVLANVKLRLASSEDVVNQILFIDGLHCVVRLLHVISDHPSHFTAAVTLFSTLAALFVLYRHVASFFYLLVFKSLWVTQELSVRLVQRVLGQVVQIV